METNETKTKSLRVIRNANTLTNRSATPTSPELFLLRIVPGLLPGYLPKPRMIIPIMVRSGQNDAPQPVKILHR